jgi:hypothetical protein
MMYLRDPDTYGFIIHASTAFLVSDGPDLFQPRDLFAWVLRNGYLEY